MSNLELTNVNIKNAKIKKDLLKKICFYFSKDYTASLTASKLELSRQTINHYYKIIRITLLQKQDETILTTFKQNIKYKTFDIKYIKINNIKTLYLEQEEKIYFLHEKCLTPFNIDSYIKDSIKQGLSNHKKANAVRVILNKNNKETIISGFFSYDNSKIQNFISNHLKQFRGLNKDNVITHIKESQFRYNYSSSSIFNTLVNVFNL